MKKIVRTIPFIIAAMVLAIGNANAQTDSCITYLKNANTSYEQRDFDGAIKLLQTALIGCNLDRADKIQAHKLLALSYLGIDNLEAADKEAEAIVKINPNYTPDKFKDEPKYSSLFGKFKPVPVFRIGISAGINHALPDAINTYSIVHNDDAPDLGEYAGNTGFQLGLRAEYRAYKNLWVEAGGLFRQSEYDHTLFDVEATTISYSEVLSYVDVPVSLKFYVLNKDINPYVEAGAAFSFVTNALGTTSRDELQDIVNRTDYRNISSVGYFGGAGCTYRLKSFLLSAGFRYAYYPDHVNKEGTRYADLTNVFKYYYIDDDFRMDNWQINIGAAYTIAYRNKKTK